MRTHSVTLHSPVSLRLTPLRRLRLSLLQTSAPPRTFILALITQAHAHCGSPNTDYDVWQYE